MPGEAQDDHHDVDMPRSHDVDVLLGTHKFCRWGVLARQPCSSQRADPKVQTFVQATSDIESGVGYSDPPGIDVPDNVSPSC